jgi:hypothetical protein
VGKAAFGDLAATGRSATGFYYGLSPRDAHPLTESFDTTDARTGTRYGLMLVAALAQR